MQLVLRKSATINNKNFTNNNGTAEPIARTALNNRMNQYLMKQTNRSAFLGEKYNY